MRRHTLHAALLMILAIAHSARAQSGHVSHPLPRPAEELEPAATPDGPEAPPTPEPGLPILVRPATLASQIGELAGHHVRVPYSRVVGVFNPRVFLIDTATRLPPAVGHRGRVLVLVARGPLRVPDATIVASTVTVLGVARTLLGVQVSGEVPWPVELRPEVVKRLEIRAAVLASSVRTAEGIELTIRD